jgi:RNA polymerase sigma factor (sigma-70 family)
MPTNPTNPLLGQLRRVVFLDHGGGLSDGELLQCFLAHREEGAFAALVRRHGRMVLGVCRRILKNEHDAEDAFQATFLVLVRKAASFLSRQTVGDWLYGVAYHVALKARAAALRRRAKERQVRDMPRSEGPDEAVWRDLRPLLDRELHRLPARYRVPVVLCDLEDKTRKEAAAEVGCPEGTLSSRLARGRVLLARRLARHGLALSGGSLALVLARHTASAAMPGPLVTSTARAAALAAAGQAVTAGVISAPVAALIEGAVNAMFANKLKTTLALVLALGVAGTGAVVLRPALADKPAAAPAVKGKPVKPGAEVSTEVSGVVRAVDTAKNTIALISKQPGAKTFEVARDVKVLLDDGRGGKLGFEEGRLSDVTEGAGVTLRLSADRKTVVRILVEGAQVRGTLKAVDAAKGTITVAVPVSKLETEDKVFELTKDASVIVSAGKLKVKGGPEQHALADLPAGAHVTLKLSAVRKVVVSVQAEGQDVRGVVKAVDADKKTLTVDVQEGKQAAEKVFAVLPAASIGVDDGKPKGKGKPAEARLSDVPVGAHVTLVLSLDGKGVVSVWAEGATVTGTVKGIDPGKNTLTLSVLRSKTEPVEEKTFDVPRDVSLQIDGKEAKLADVPLESSATFKMGADQKSIAAIYVAGPGAFGEVKAVDAANGSITLASKAGEHTYAVGKEARISIDDKAGTLADVPVGAQVKAQLSADQKAILSLGAGGASIKGTLKGVDADKKKVTVAVLVSKVETEDKTFDVAGDAVVVTEINGVLLRLADLKGDKQVVLQMSADGKTVRHITVLGE